MKKLIILELRMSDNGKSGISCKDDVMPRHEDSNHLDFEVHHYYVIDTLKF